MPYALHRINFHVVVEDSRSACQFWYKERRKHRGWHWNAGQFSIYYPIFGHETWPLVKKSRTCTHVMPQKGRNWTYCRATGRKCLWYGPIFKIAILRHETWLLAKVPEVAHIVSFYRSVSNLSLFSFYGHQFQGYRFHVHVIFGHITWKLTKSSNAPSFCPIGLKLSLFSLYG